MPPNTMNAETKQVHLLQGPCLFFLLNHFYQAEQQLIKQERRIIRDLPFDEWLIKNGLAQQVEAVAASEPEQPSNDPKISEDSDEENEFDPCNECDLPDACADYGCAIKTGVVKPLFA